MKMLPGDMIACADRSWISRLIRFRLQGPISHIACVYDDKRLVEPTGKYWGRLIYTDFAERFAEYRHGGGVMLHFRLSDEYRAKLDISVYQEWLALQVRKERPYSIFNALACVCPFLTAKEDYRSLTCSFTYAAAMEQGGAFPQINAAEVHPMNLCELAAWMRIDQLCGPKVSLRQFNRTSYRTFRKKIKD